MIIEDQPIMTIVIMSDLPGNVSITLMACCPCSRTFRYPMSFQFFIGIEFQPRIFFRLTSSEMAFPIDASGPMFFPVLVIDNLFALVALEPNLLEHFECDFVYICAWLEFILFITIVAIWTSSLVF